MKLFETEKHDTLRKFYTQNGLEVSQSLDDDGAVFSIFYRHLGKTIGAATLSKRSDIFVLDYVAVDGSHRREGLGSKLVEAALKKARLFGAEEVYISTKKPSFFKSFGFFAAGPDGIDLNADCKGCPQLGTSCSPKIMKYIFNGDSI